MRSSGAAAPDLAVERGRGVVGFAGQETPHHNVGSAFRLAEVARNLTLQEWTAKTLEDLRGAAVVLVDDWSDSGWTLTVAAALLRAAGAAAVHPVVLAPR